MLHLLREADVERALESKDGHDVWKRNVAAVERARPSTWSERGSGHDCSCPVKIAFSRYTRALSGHTDASATSSADAARVERRRASRTCGAERDRRTRHVGAPRSSAQRIVAARSMRPTAGLVANRAADSARTPSRRSSCALSTGQRDAGLGASCTSHRMARESGVRCGRQSASITGTSMSHSRSRAGRPARLPSEPTLAMRGRTLCRVGPR